MSHLPGSWLSVRWSLLFLIAAVAGGARQVLVSTVLLSVLVGAYLLRSRMRQMPPAGRPPRRG